MAKPRPRLNVFGQQLLLARTQTEGWPVAQAAGVSRAIAYKWLRHFGAEGEQGLLERGPRLHRSPRAVRPEIAARAA